MKFSRPEHWRFRIQILQGNHPNPGIKPRSAALQDEFLAPGLLGKSFRSLFNLWQYIMNLRAPSWRNKFYSLLVRWNFFSNLILVETRIFFHLFLPFLVLIIYDSPKSFIKMFTCLFLIIMKPMFSRDIDTITIICNLFPKLIIFIKTFFRAILGS